jgi:hypothetical protein
VNWVGYILEINEFLLSKLDKLDSKLDDIKKEQIESRVALQSHEERDKLIHEDVKGAAVQLTEQSKLLAIYNQSLQEHMRRTALLEDKVEPMHVEFKDRQVHDKVKSDRLKRRVKWLGVIGIIIGIVAGIVQIITML